MSFGLSECKDLFIDLRMFYHRYGIVPRVFSNYFLEWDFHISIKIVTERSYICLLPIYQSIDR